MIERLKTQSVESSHCNKHRGQQTWGIDFFRSPVSLRIEDSVMSLWWRTFLLIRITHWQMSGNDQNLSRCSTEWRQSLLKWVVNLLLALSSFICFSSGNVDSGALGMASGIRIFHVERFPPLGLITDTHTHHSAEDWWPLKEEWEIVLCLFTCALSKPRWCVSVACTWSHTEGRGPRWALVLKSPYNSLRTFEEHLSAAPCVHALKQYHSCELRILTIVSVQPTSQWAEQATLTVLNPHSNPFYRYENRFLSSKALNSWFRHQSLCSVFCDANWECCFCLTRWGLGQLG